MRNKQLLVIDIISNNNSKPLLLIFWTNFPVVINFCQSKFLALNSTSRKSIDSSSFFFLLTMTQTTMTQKRCQVFIFHIIYFKFHFLINAFRIIKGEKQ